MVKSHIITGNSAVIILGKKTTTVYRSDPRWDEIIDLLYKQQYEEAVKLASEELEAYRMAQANKIISETSVDNFKFMEVGPESPGAIQWDGKYIKAVYKNIELPAILQKRLYEMLNEGRVDGIKAMPMLVENILSNPDPKCREAVYEFLENRCLPICYEDGTFIAYKGVNNDLWSVHGNPNTRVISGQVDENGRIYNGIGSIIEVVRQDVNVNPDQHCSWGLHVGAKTYASGFAPRLLLVKVNPKDVVVVPNDDCEKCRVSRYEVLCDWDGSTMDGIVATVRDGVVRSTQSDVSPSKRVMDKLVAVANKFVQHINEYLNTSAVQTAPIAWRDVNMTDSESIDPDYVSEEHGFVFDDCSDSSYPVTVNTDVTTYTDEDEDGDVVEFDVRAGEIVAQFPDRFIQHSALVRDVAMDLAGRVVSGPWSAEERQALNNAVLTFVLKQGFTVREVNGASIVSI